MRPAPVRPSFLATLAGLTSAFALLLTGAGGARAQTPPATAPAGAPVYPAAPAGSAPQTAPGYPAAGYPPSQAQAPYYQGAPGQPAQTYQAAPGQPDPTAPAAGQTYQAAPGQTYQPPAGGAYPEQPPPPYGPPPGYTASPPGYYAPPPYQAPPTGYPAPPPPYMQYRAPGAETHDGFYLRLHLGGGFTTMRASLNGVKEEFSGGSAAFGMALGGSVSPNLVLYGAFALTTTSNPTHKLRGVSDALFPNTSATTGGFGVGAAYYLMPANVYLAGTVLATQFQVTDDRLDSDDEAYAILDTRYGIGFEALVGKEWWVSDNWGLGGAVQFLLGTSKEKQAAASSGPNTTWTTTAVSLVFSATYN